MSRTVLVPIESCLLCPSHESMFILNGLLFGAIMLTLKNELEQQAVYLNGVLMRKERRDETDITCTT